MVAGALQAARVVARFGSRYAVVLDGAPGQEPTDAIARGRRQDIVVGDRVHCAPARGVQVIDSVAPRRNLLFRSDALRVKPLASNVDQIAVVLAPQPTPQIEFAWRALLAAGAAGVAALVVLNKTDLDGAGIGAAVDELERLGATVVRISARTAPDAAREALDAHCRERVTLFVGQSGMGKSTLLTLLLGTELRTGAISRSGSHGRQTTSATQWYFHGGNGALIDSPGFHEFGLAHLAPLELLAGMPDFARHAGKCRFSNCRHVDEPDCAIRAALSRGEISEARYGFYRRLLLQPRPHP
jgi:ribosome biogenesis GTPase / thiamine phosphate phosphatase